MNIFALAPLGLEKFNDIESKVGKGWKPGESIRNLTSTGRKPSWSTIRSRYWKNKALNSKENEFSKEDLGQMKNGKPPLRYDPGTGKIERVELHHPNGREGDNIYDFEEKLPSEHAQLDRQRRIKKSD